MTVRELIEQLSSVEPDRIVVMSKDAEGNGYSPLADWWGGSYKAETTWYGEAGLESLTPEMEAKGYGDGDVVRGVPAIILQPVN